MAESVKLIFCDCSLARTDAVRTDRCYTIYIVCIFGFVGASPTAIWLLSVAVTALCLVSTIPLPFFRSVATVAVERENGIAGNVFPYTVRMKWPERWLAVHLRQHGKNRIRS